MDEARAVLTRLRRIEALQRERAGSRAILAEVECLLDEARRWLDAEGGDARAAATVALLRDAVDRTREVTPVT